MKKAVREWFQLDEHTIEQFIAIMGEPLLNTMKDSICTKTPKKFPMTRITASLQACDIRRVSTMAPDILSTEGFDLFENDVTEFVVFVQDGKIISAYQETR